MGYSEDYVSKLRDKAEKLEHKLADSYERVAELEIENEEVLAVRITALEDEVERLREQWEESSRYAFQQENERLRAELTGMGKRAESFEMAWNASKAEVERLLKQANDVADMLGESQREVERLRAEVDDTEKQRTDEGRGEYVAHGTFSRMAAEKLLLQKDLDITLLRATNAEREVERLRGRVKYLEGRVPGDGWVRVEEVERLRENVHNYYDVARNALAEERKGGENAENSRGRTRVYVPSETGEREVQSRPQDYTGLSDDYPA